MTHRINTTLAVCLVSGLIVSCGKESAEPTVEEVAHSASPTVTAPAQTGGGAGDTAQALADTTADTNNSSQWTELNSADMAVDEGGSDMNQAAISGAGDIPYPIYPNGTKYRVGGENGLKIVLFQTEDTFEEVDAYYQAQAASEAGMPRLSAMNDYVRYSTNAGDSDPWATTQPGIVIHQFNDEAERRAVGATEAARTNIIMSFE